MSTTTKKSTPEVRAHIKNLVALAKVDGDLDRTELEYIVRTAEKNGVSLSQVQSIIKSTISYKFNTNFSKESQFENLYEMVELMLADGVLTEEEIDFCTQAAKNMGMKSVTAALIVRKLAQGLQLGRSKGEIQDELELLMNY